jgi:hypothetical protein
LLTSPPTLDLPGKVRPPSVSMEQSLCGCRSVFAEPAELAVEIQGVQVSCRCRISLLIVRESFVSRSLGVVSSLRVVPCNKLKDAHLHLTTFRKMNVRSAVQVRWKWTEYFSYHAHELSIIAFKGILILFVFLVLHTVANASS